MARELQAKRHSAVARLIDSPENRLMNLFSDEMRRDPFPAYRQLRHACPVLHLPAWSAWLILDYDSVKRALSNHDAFSSAVPAPGNWFIFKDPPEHTRLRSLIARAFTPRSVAELAPRIRELTRYFLDPALERGAMDLAEEFSVPLPMMVIAELLGIPAEELPRYKRWSDEILKLSYSLFRGKEEVHAIEAVVAVTVEMRAFLPKWLEQRRSKPRNDLLSRLVLAQVDDARLTDDEILGFVQLLLVGGQETTANLINNAILSFIEFPDQLSRLRGKPELLASAIEEVLRYRAPLQWVMRTPRRDITLHGQSIAAGQLVLAVIGSANRDPARFHDADCFDIGRDPNPHLSFGTGIHACVGAPLARLEARIALEYLLSRMGDFALATSAPWEPRRALNVLGPARLPIRFALK